MTAVCPTTTATTAGICSQSLRPVRSALLPSRTAWHSATAIPSSARGYGKCDGNGFKLGGSGVGSAHVVKNCLAFENLNCGFTDNNNPKLDSLTNCTAYNNGVGSNGKPNVSCYRCTDDGADFSNLISYYSKGESHRQPGRKRSEDHQRQDGRHDPEHHLL